MENSVENLAKKASEILATVRPGKDIYNRRIKALNEAGFAVGPGFLCGSKDMVKTSGYVWTKNGAIYCQLECSFLARGRKVAYIYELIYNPGFVTTKISNLKNIR